MSFYILNAVSTLRFIFISTYNLYVSRITEANLTKKPKYWRKDKIYDFHINAQKYPKR